MKKRTVKLTLVALAAATIMSIQGCESCSRSLKTLGSDFGGGLDRKMCVYSYSGILLQQYQGTFDIESSEIPGKVVFDLNGKRHIIYGAIVIVDEN